MVSLGSGRRRWGVLVLLRHGESTANAAGIFTGALDVPLTARGVAEARRAGALLKDAELPIGTVLCSAMQRARETADIVAAALPGPLAVLEDWRLNERNYGALTGRSKAEVLREFGERQFLTWRRSVDVAPPPMTPLQRAGIARTGPLHAGLGSTESLRDVVDRVRACYAERIRPAVAAGAGVLVVAHGNSLRALCVVLDRLSDESVRRLNLPTGQPLVYRFGSGEHPETPGGSYLDPATAIAAAAAIAREGGT